MRETSALASFYGTTDTTAKGLPLREGAEDQDVSPKHRTRLGATLSMALALALCVAALVAYGGQRVAAGQGTSDQLTSLRSSHPSSTKSTSNSISIDISNAYSALGFDAPGEKYGFFDPDKLIEPMRETTLTASISSGSSSVSTCSWTVRDTRSSVSSNDVYESIRDKAVASHQTFEGKSVTLRVPSPGEYKVHVSCELESGETMEHSDTLVSYYVRRELRELTDEDREDFLDALEKIYYCEDSYGELYGEYFHCAEYFTEYHLAAAGAVRTDHIHDGLGFLPQHIAMTNEFEIALQAVNSKIAMPYWDYTIDSIEIRKHEDTESWFFKESELFSEKWFGRTSETDHVISDGRFAYLTVPRASEDAAIQSPYGYMRAPWNLNPSKYVTRYHKVCGVKNAITDALQWPTCGTHYRLVFSDDYDTYKDYTWQAIYIPHGPVHSWIGGVGGGTCEERVDKLSEFFTESNVEIYKSYTFVMLKNMYRGQYLNTPKDCDMNDSDSCKFHCVRGTGKESKALDLYLREELWRFFGFDKHTVNSLTTDQMQEIADALICENVYWPGDQLESGSPSDPAFWPIHPTMERLFQFKALVKPFTEVSFDYSGMQLCLYSAKSDCEGHHAYDPTYFATTIYDENTGEWTRSMLTNEEVLHAALPKEASYSVPYIYNHFRWPHCEHEGWDFTATRHDA